MYGTAKEDGAEMARLTDPVDVDRLEGGAKELPLSVVSRFRVVLTDQRRLQNCETK
jgi:hypothetical protein